MTGVDDFTISRLADMCAALGAEPRLRIVRLLLTAQPGGMFAGAIQEELGITGSTLSHHLDKLRVAGLVNVRREHQFLWYSANAETLRELLGFLYAECCTRNRVVNVASILRGSVMRHHEEIRSTR
jgi:ArsR family transcriptional regulator